MKSSYASHRIKEISSFVEINNYLEIGVFDGRTFLNVDFKNKVGVDPYFRFDYKSNISDKSKLIQVTSDEYFSNLIERGEQFDLIFIDGLHEFKQTLRDICASVAHSHERTLWIIDDVYPVDVFSSWPEQMKAINFRKEQGLEGGQWHGDVYKVVFFIHDYMPSFSYITISDGANRQLLMWKEPRENFSPEMKSLKDIEDMHYFLMREKDDIFNLTPWSECLSLLKQIYK